jgi:hypothetical protein
MGQKSQDKGYAKARELERKLFAGMAKVKQYPFTPENDSETSAPATTGTQNKPTGSTDIQLTA